MKKLIILLAPLFYTNLLFAQSPMSAFDNLIGSKWILEGEWGNGQKFKQEYEFEWSLGKKMVKVKTFGTINIETGEYGLRNEGVRFWQKDEEKILFYEFDVYGGATDGLCTTEGNNIYYTYEYQGGIFKDSWIFQNKDTYQLTIESIEDGKRKELYQTSIIKRVTDISESDR